MGSVSNITIACQYETLKYLHRLGVDARLHRLGDDGRLHRLGVDGPLRGNRPNHAADRQRERQNEDDTRNVTHA